MVIDRTQLAEKLFVEFPILFKRTEKSSKYSIYLFGLECDRGWFNIIYDLCANIAPLISLLPEDERESIYVVQIKEKFGGLRFYMSQTTKEIDICIREAEDKAYKTCEMCGKPGKHISILGWYKTLCEKDMQSETNRLKAIFKLPVEGA